MDQILRFFQSLLVFLVSSYLIHRSGDISSIGL